MSVAGPWTLRASWLRELRRRRSWFLLLAVAACSSGDVSVRKDVADECRSSSDCPGGQICSRGICEEANPSLRCREDYECPTGQDCVNGYCESPRSTPRDPSRAPR